MHVEESPAHVYFVLNFFFFPEKMKGVPRADAADALAPCMKEVYSSRSQVPL